MRRLRLGGLAAILGLALLAVAAWTPTASAGTTCKVTDGHASYTSLADAVSAATPNDTLDVHGTCIGTTRVDEALTIEGKGNSPTLDGGGQGAVLFNTSGNLATVSDLTITDGSDGLLNGGHLTLNDSTVGNNTDVGIKGVGGSLTLNDSTVGNNSGSGGIMVESRGSLTLNTSTVSNNTDGTGAAGGITALNDSTVTLNSSTVSNNTETGSFGAGGVRSNGGTVTLNSSTISNNRCTVYDCTGGIAALQTLKLNASTISNNIGTAFGGGIYFNSGATYVNTGTIISHNAATDGGGIYNDAGGTLYLDGGSITNNTATDEGGGIYNVGTLIYGTPPDVTSVTHNNPDNVFPA